MKYLLSFWVLIFLYACAESSVSTCSEIKGDAVVLKGDLMMDSKGQFILADYEDSTFRKIEVIPCDKTLEDYVKNAYDASIWLRNKEEQFLVRIDGQYISEEGVLPRRFLFDFVAFLDDI